MTELRVIPLGGFGELGMNLLVYEHGDDAIVVDCGMMLPDDAAPGVDAIVPEMTYLFENASKVRALFVTHGHEEHVGAIPFLLDELAVPVYAMPLTLAFIAERLAESGIDDIELRAMLPREIVEAGPFRVEALRVTHSMSGALGFAITTPSGTIVHTGDFKLDHTPADGQPMDLARFAHYGEQGVTLLVSDSTNALSVGHSQSERSVGVTFDRIFAGAPGRIIIAVSALDLHRVQSVVDAAVRHRRRVFVIGSALIDNIEIAEKLGHLRFPETTCTATTDLHPRSLVILTGGAQGEPASALTRMAIGEHKEITIDKDDRVVIASPTLIGNERQVTHMIDNLYRRGATVYDPHSGVHVSGHAHREELKLMLSVTRPRFFIPMHGTLRDLKHHALLAREAGVPHGVVITNGQVAVLDRGELHVLPDSVPHGKVFIDAEAEEVPDVVVRDRQHLAEDGFVIAVVAVGSNGRLIRDPEIITRGLVDANEGGDVLPEVRQMLVGMFDESAADELRDSDLLQEKIRALLKRYFRKSMGARPMILPVIWET